MAAIR